MIKSFYFDLDGEITNAALIKKRVKAYRNDLLNELEPKALASLLSKSEIVTENDIEFVKKAHGCSERVENLLSLVENGDSQVVEEFVKILNDLGYSHIVQLIDPPDIHNKAGKNLPDISIHICKLIDLNFIYVYLNSIYFVLQKISGRK